MPTPIAQPMAAVPAASFQLRGLPPKISDWPAPWMHAFAYEPATWPHVRLGSWSES
jgi:hypothetical protein